MGLCIYLFLIEATNKAIRQQIKETFLNLKDLLPYG